jgi:vanillate O-demethylase ferredoxin subunit
LSNVAALCRLNDEGPKELLNANFAAEKTPYGTAMIPNDPFRTLRVSARVQETADIVSFELMDPAGGELPRFTAGAHIDIEAGAGLVRQYSLFNDPGDRRCYKVGILKDSNSSGGSIAMHTLRAGDYVRIAGPRNHFPLHPGAHETLLLAGGIGITPLLCMAQQLHRDGAAFKLHYCVRSSSHAAFLPLLRSSPFASHVTVHCDDGGDAQRLDIAAVLGALRPDAHIYVCGPGGFVAWCIGAAAAANIPEAQVHREYFKAAAPANVTVENEFEIRLASSGQTFNVPADMSILNVLRAHGVALQASCETGVCGTCLTGVLAGTPDHRDLYLSKAEREAGKMILPCCSRSISPTLVLDI